MQSADCPTLVLEDTAKWSLGLRQLQPCYSPNGGRWVPHQPPTRTVGVEKPSVNLRPSYKKRTTNDTRSNKPSVMSVRNLSETTLYADTATVVWKTQSNQRNVFQSIPYILAGAKRDANPPQLN